MKSRFAPVIFAAGIFALGPVLADKGDNDGRGAQRGKNNGELRDDRKQKKNDRKDKSKTEKSETEKSQTEKGKEDHIDGWNGCSA